MPTPSEESLALLRSIDASLKAIAASLRGGGSTAAGAPSQGPAIADDRDLDGKFGDEIVKVSPRDWHGQAFKGRKMSECSAEFLDMLADTFEYFAKKNDKTNETTDKGEPKSTYDRRSAARARGWALRKRENRMPRPAQPPVHPGGDWTPAGDIARAWPQPAGLMEPIDVDE